MKNSKICLFLEQSYQKFNTIILDFKITMKMNFMPINIKTKKKWIIFYKIEISKCYLKKV